MKMKNAGMRDVLEEGPVRIVAPARAVERGGKMVQDATALLAARTSTNAWSRQDTIHVLWGP